PADSFPPCHCSAALHGAGGRAPPPTAAVAGPPSPGYQEDDGLSSLSPAEARPEHSARATQMSPLGDLLEARGGRKDSHVLKSLLRVITFLPLLLATGRVASAAPAVYQYGGTTSSAMSVNDGTSVGSIPAGTPFSGTFMFDVPQTATPVAFGGGTHSTYSFTETTLTVGTTTVRWGPGTIDVYDNLTSATSGYPIGDSLYININGVPPSGPINGAQFNWIFLGFVDGRGTAISGGALPSNLSLSAFQSAFIEFNYGTQGTPWGAGNTSTLQPLTSLSGSGGVPGISFAPTLPNGVVGTPYSATFAAASGGAGGFTYTAAGLPAGLTLAGTTVSGTPTAAGTSNVTLTATDSAGTSLAVTVTVTIADPAPVACSGKDAVVTAYVARNPGYIVVNGGLNLLDHLWTTNLTAANTTFLGGLVNWYQTGLIVSYTGTTDPNGCILSSLTVAPGVTITTSTLPEGTVGAAYSAPVDVAWGVAPYQVGVSGLPSGLTFDGAKISGTPRAAGSFAVTISARDAVGGSAAKSLTLVVAAAPITFAPTLPNGTE